MSSPRRKAKAAFSEDQLKFFKCVRDGKSVFLSGIAGSGKSFCLTNLINFRHKKEHSMRKSLRSKMKPIRKKNIAVTASTGAAAMLIGGTTVHSWSGIGLGRRNKEDLVLKVRKNRVARHNWQRTDILIIDEISMISAELFDKLEYVARHLRDNKLPFGGIQLILTGDFAQLPPVIKREDSIPEAYLKRKYTFSAFSWDQCVHEVVYLQESFRQGDPYFVNMLNQVREGVLPKSLYKLVNNPLLDKIDDDFITKLYSKRDDVEEMNKRKIAELDGQEYVLNACDSGKLEYMGFLQKHSRYPDQLRLKVGTCVMLIRNIQVERGLVNGAQGVVLDISKDLGSIDVLFNKTGVIFAVEREVDTVEIDGIEMAKRSQFPLIPSYALTIHKSQGISCPYVEVDLSNCFEYGQAYTALSRAISLDGLRIKRISPICVKAAPEVIEFYKQHTQSFEDSIEFVVDVDPN